MQELMLKIEDLKPSPMNVRSNHSKEDIQMMAHSLLTRGLINPIQVVKSPDGKYEVVAGLLRLKGAIAAKLESIRGVDVTHLSKAELVDISLSENMERRQMTAMQMYQAFDKLFREGFSVEEIASRYKQTEREVQRLLAIGGLPKKILQLYEDGEINDKGLRALAIAPKAQVAAFCKLPDKERPEPWRIPEWLKGTDGEFHASNALFDLSLYDGPTITDLFAEQDEVILTDGAQFWRLQNTAIDDEITKLENLGWPVERVDWFGYGYEKASKANGGKVFVAIDKDNGCVTFHKGYKKAKRTGTAPTTTKSNDNNETKPEVSEVFQHYMYAARHYGLVHHMINNEADGLVTALALLIKECDNISLYGNRVYSKNDAYNESLQMNADFEAVQDAYKSMLKTLKLDEEHHFFINLRELITTLKQHDLTQLTKWVIVTLAYKWQSYPGEMNADYIAVALGLESIKEWKADDVFWNGIKNKQTLIDIANDFGIPINKESTAKKIRETIKGKETESWRPKWARYG